MSFGRDRALYRQSAGRGRLFPRLNRFHAPCTGSRPSSPQQRAHSLLPRARWLRSRRYSGKVLSGKPSILAWDDSQASSARRRAHSLDTGALSRARWLRSRRYGSKVLGGKPSILAWDGSTRHAGSQASSARRRRARPAPLRTRLRLGRPSSRAALYSRRKGAPQAADTPTRKRGFLPLFPIPCILCPGVPIGYNDPCGAPPQPAACDKEAHAELLSD